MAGVGAEARAEVATARRALAEQRTRALTASDELRGERSRTEQGESLDPVPPPWRTDRAGRAGAPLWRLVDVDADTFGDTVDSVESALVAAGLADAWVCPDGRIDLGSDTADLVLTARVRTGRTLRSILHPAADAAENHGVAAEVVSDVLASIPLVDATIEQSTGTVSISDTDIAIGTDRSFRLGSAVGRGARQRGVLLGSAARERHRLSRLAELDTAIAELDAELTELERSDEDWQRRRAAIDTELAAQPPGQPVLDAERVLADAGSRLTETRRRLEDALSKLRDAEEAVRDTLRALTALAAQHGLPADGPGLAEVDDGLSRFGETARTWTRRRRDLSAAERSQEREAIAAREAAEALRLAEEEKADAHGQAHEVSQRVSTLEGSIGAEHADTVQRINDLTAERATNRQRTQQLGAELDALREKIGGLQATVVTAENRRVNAERRRDRVHRRFVAVVGDLGGDARLDVSTPLDTASAVLAAARAVAEDTSGRARTAPERLSERVRERVHSAQALLGAQVDVDRELANPELVDTELADPGLAGEAEPDEGGWWVLRTTAAGLRRGVGALVDALSGELDQARAELVADEERLFEQTLAGSVRRALAENIRRANSLVDTINEQLGAIRTAAAGVQVRLRWDVDSEQPDAVRSARTLLLRDPADLTDDQRHSLQEFVRARVDQARAELDLQAPWEARLRESLDYRRWHRFTLQVAHRDWDGFVPATQRRLQRLSTGERSIALHLPMIASVAAHYVDEFGNPSQCPRLILLDELFAGVDTANRSQLFGPFTTWGLDAVFTSDHEWCQYADLDGIAIHHLHPPTADEPVTSTRFTWDGHQRLIDAG